MTLRSDACLENGLKRDSIEYAAHVHVANITFHDLNHAQKYLDHIMLGRQAAHTEQREMQQHWSRYSRAKLTRLRTIDHSNTTQDRTT